MTDLTPACSAPPALDFHDLAQEVARQPDLFAAISAVAEEQNTVRAARERRYTGSRVPEARAAQIVALRLAGGSLREIERQTGADKRTVAAVVQIAEKQGLVPPLKEGLQRRLGELAERTADVVERELDSDVPDAQLIKAGWVGLGIAADKSAALANVGELHLHLHQGAVASGPDPAAEYARLLRGAPVGPTVDAESEVSTSERPPIVDVRLSDTGMVRGPAPVGASVDPADPSGCRDLGPGDAGPEAGDGGGGAGGVAKPAVGGVGDGKA